MIFLEINLHFRPILLPSVHCRPCPCPLQKTLLNQMILVLKVVKYTFSYQKNPLDPTRRIEKAQQYYYIENIESFKIKNFYESDK